MIGKLVDMALASWERALTPDPKKFESHHVLMEALAAMGELQRQIEMIRNNGGVRLEFGVRSEPSEDK